jgi:DNA-binding CsgD family transcriptional regulator
MRTRETHGTIDRNRNLTKPAALERLLAMMELWWQGKSLADIARGHGISRQRPGTILARDGCTRALWRIADNERSDSSRCGWRHGMERARAALLHPLAHRLTVRQRAALAWQAQGLALPDIARRMRATSQNVRCLQQAGYWRLERLSQRKMPRDGIDIGPIEWADVARLAEMSSGRSNASITEALAK